MSTEERFLWSAGIEMTPNYQGYFSNNKWYLSHVHHDSVTILLQDLFPFL